MANGPQRLRWTAPPSTMGNKGKTQGDRMLRLPESQLNPQ
jgi:hypothetical protein